MILTGDVVPADLPALPPLLDQLGYPVDPDVLPARLERIRRGGGRVLVAREGDVVLGFVAVLFLPLLHHHDDLCRISALVVDERARGRGVGRRLVHEAEIVAREHGCTRIEVTSNARRAPAHAFYETLGYQETRKRFLKTL